jgi:hypothetical protein
LNVRIGTPAALAAAVCLVVAGTARAASVQRTLAGARLGAYTATYAITGKVRGTYTLRVGRPRGGAVTVNVTEVLKGYTERDAFVLSARGLRLRSAKETLEADRSTATLDAAVSGGKAKVTVDDAGTVQHVTLAMGSTAVMNDVLLETLAALHLKGGEKIVITDVVFKSATEVRMGVSVGRRTTVRTPAGRFSAYPLTLATAAGHQTEWVSSAGGGVMVKYANGQTTFTLAKFER